MKILVGVDFSRDSREAVRFVSVIQFTSGSELSIAHIIKVSKELHDLSQSVDLEEGIRTVRQQSRHQATKHVHRLQNVLPQPNLKLTIDVKEGSVGEELESLLIKKRIDLAVLGTRGIAGIKRFLLGSVSEGILLHAPCSVLIVRGQARWLQRGLRILMAIDESSESQTALQFLNQLQFPVNSELILFHVVEPVDYQVVQDNYGIVKLGRQEQVTLANFEKERWMRLEKSRKALLKDAQRKMRIKKVKGESISTGVAAEEILKAAKRFRSDLIVMGSRDITGIKRTFLGSVSQKVVRHASCSVLVVRKSPKRGKVRL